MPLRPMRSAHLMTPSSEVSPGPVTDLVTRSGTGGEVTLCSLAGTLAASLLITGPASLSLVSILMVMAAEVACCASISLS